MNRVDTCTLAELDVHSSGHKLGLDQSLNKQFCGGANVGQGGGTHAVTFIHIEPTGSGHGVPPACAGLIMVRVNT